MKSFCTVIFFTFFFNATMFAQPGSPDTKFGQEGKEYFSDMHTNIKSIIVQSDSKIVIGGSHSAFEIQDLGIAIARFEADGSKDIGFGNEGEVIIKSAGLSKGVSVIALAQQTDRKILACARFVTQDGDIGVIRLNEDGSLDNTFGSNGVVIISVGTEDLIGGMVLQADGKIVVAGKKGVGASQGGDFVLRLLSDGKTDNTFGTKGIVVTDYISSATLGAVTQQPDGKILTSGIYGVITKQIQVTRYNSNGHIDSTFGVNGLARLIPATEDRYALKVNDMSLQPDGKILVAGSAENYRMSVARFSSNGEPDLSFVTDKGYAVLAMDEGTAEARSVFFSSGRIILTGRYSVKGGISVASVAYMDNGMLDSSFGENGIASSGFDTLANGTTYESGEGAIQKDGKIVLSGSFLENEDNFYNLALFRFNGYTEEKYVRIKKWLHHHGFTWDDWPGNKISYYTVQRSSNGSGFTEIARLFNRNQQQFSYTDAAPLAGDNYYRLAAVSADGSTAYSNVLAIPNNTAAVKVYPNPAKNNLLIEGLSAAAKTKLIITDLNGVARMTTTINSNTYNWNISNLKPGNYILQVIVNGNSIVAKKIIKE